jgi:Protein similar to CwfJ C-terminus 1/Protein similar to CwfJ C-terminus 2
VVGDIDGRFSEVFPKISNLHAKNQFSFAIILGNLFAHPDHDAKYTETIANLLSGQIKVPLPTYFSLGKHPLPEAVIEKLEKDAGEVCENLYFLGKKTTLTTSEGVKIVALGGQLDTSITGSSDKYTPFHSQDDAKALRGANSADLLITTDWPTDVRRGSKVECKDTTALEDPSISELCTILKPKYHFSPSVNAFYEREPFFFDKTEDTGLRPITRFLSLAGFGNAQKAKWLYAFSITPNEPPPMALPAGATASPFKPVRSQKRPREESGQHYSRFEAPSGRGAKGRRRDAAPPPGPGECFFCLSYEQLEKHLITSIGNDSYLTIAKGPLPTSSTSPTISFPSHILIIPLTHAPTLASIEEASSRQSTFDEMTRYRKALEAMLATRKLGAVTWEVSRSWGVHTHWQVVPLPGSMAGKLVEAAFRVEAENERYPVKFERRAVGDDENDFFRVWITSAPKEEVEAEDGSSEDAEISMAMPLGREFRFDLQFGRRVMAKLLGLEDRFDWKECGQSQEEEVKDATAFKKAFKNFDFSLEE